MATGNHAGNDAEVHRLKQVKALDLFHPRSTPADEANMRQVSSQPRDQTTEKAALTRTFWYLTKTHLLPLM